MISRPKAVIGGNLAFGFVYQSRHESACDVTLTSRCNIFVNSSLTVLALTQEAKSIGTIQDGVFTCEDCYLFNLTIALRSIPEHVKPTVTEIDFSGNNILIILTNVFLNFSNCVELNMAHSSIRSLRPYAFSGMDSLRKLNLSGNLIDLLREQDFMGPSALRELYLQDNRMLYVESDMFKGIPRLEILRLDGNPRLVIRSVEMHSIV